MQRCRDAETIREIVRFNNTQNEITTWDQYSSNESQKSLATEFGALGHTYSVKRGFVESVSGLGIEVVAQPILAFEEHLEDAHRGKNTIFERKATYGKAFEGKSARHSILAKSIRCKQFHDYRVDREMEACCRSIACSYCSFNSRRPRRNFFDSAEKIRIAKTVESLIIASGLSEKRTEFAALIE